MAEGKEANLNLGVRKPSRLVSGVEEFLAVEDVSQDILIGLLRLRIPSGGAHRREVDSRTAIVRELHVYGPETPVGARGGWWQHVGWGRLLLREAERIALEEYDARKYLY